MKWQRVSHYGMQSGEYRVAKAFIDGCTLYTLHHAKERLGVFNDFDEAKDAASAHQQKTQPKENDE